MAQQSMPWPAGPQHGSDPPTVPQPQVYPRGVARVNAPGREPAQRVEPPAEPPVAPPPRLPVRYHVRRLRRGGVWSGVGFSFALLCWGIWAISARGSDLTVPVIAFGLVLLVALGVFVVSRLLGRMLLERTLGRVRRTARLAHLATGVFLVVAGVGYLGQTAWVVHVWNWIMERR